MDFIMPSDKKTSPVFLAIPYNICEGIGEMWILRHLK